MKPPHMSPSVAFYNETLFRPDMKSAACTSLIRMCGLRFSVTDFPYSTIACSVSLMAKTVRKRVSKSSEAVQMR